MLRRNWAAKKLTIKPALLNGLLGVMIAACASAPTPFIVPTQTLIAATLANTPTPAPPTATLLSLPAPGDLAVTATPLTDLTQEDPVAIELANLARRRVADDTGLPVRRVRIVDVQSYVWTDTSLGCPLAGEIYTPVIVDGYRIVLSAGENEYIFHTDFDRVILCAPANEQLPDRQR